MTAEVTLRPMRNQWSLSATCAVCLAERDPRMVLLTAKMDIEFGLTKTINK